MQKISPILVQGIVNSDQNCFRTLYDAYYSYLCGFAVSLIHDFGKAQELVNDVFIRVWKNRARLKYPPLPYLISGVRNACYNYLRDTKNATEASLVLTDHIPETGYNEEDISDIVSTISEIADSLPKRCAEIFRLHFNDCMETEEICERLSIKPSTVRVQLKIALEKIREKIK